MYGHHKDCLYWRHEHAKLGPFGFGSRLDTPYPLPERSNLMESFVCSKKLLIKPQLFPKPPTGCRNQLVSRIWPDAGRHQRSHEIQEAPEGLGSGSGCGSFFAQQGDSAQRLDIGEMKPSNLIHSLFFSGPRTVIVTLCYFIIVLWTRLSMLSQISTW